VSNMLLCLCVIAEQIENVAAELRSTLDADQLSGTYVIHSCFALCFPPNYKVFVVVFICLG